MIVEAVLLWAVFFGSIRLVQTALNKLPPPMIRFDHFLRSRSPMTIRDVQINRHREAVGDVMNTAAARARIADSLDKRVTR